QLARGLERAFRVPQDVEWALDHAGHLFVVQTRPLAAFQAPDDAAGNPPAVEGYRVLVRDAVRASPGVACGRILRLSDSWSADEVQLPDDAVLLVPNTTPRLAGMVGRVRAILATVGSPTGHMATVAREFHLPCLVGVDPNLPGLEEGSQVTVDARYGLVYEGEVPELRAPANAPIAARRDPVGEGLARLLARVAPLTLTDPDSPQFRPASCETLHDVARFVHQRAMAEMFELDGLSPQERRQARRLSWRMPMDVLLLDLGGGLAPGSSRLVETEQVLSVPLLALVEGMTDPRLRWAGPVGFDLKGFMSVVVRSAADDQRYGEPSYALCSRDYLHFSSRLAYHFATVDAICGRSVNENYARFLFYGGAAVAARREFRAHFLASVLRSNGFAVKMLGDRVEAILSKREADAVEESLVMLGRLMVASRHLDMVMESRGTAESFAQAFLSGDYGFELVRKG
ncbi:MAG TPA: PEP-utilizing enzyme, partial [Vicinamibacteria bacterium]|nr:PEP-utilizing enzyme [Vicinamibacteria bacterium]